MRLERSLWAAFLIPTLVPELGAGVSTGELLAIVSCLSAGATLLIRYARAASLPSAVWVIAAYLMLSFFGLVHDPIGHFSAHFAGGLAFTIAAAVGGCVPTRLFGHIVRWLFLLALVGATLDIAIDLSGWTPDASKKTSEWEEGVRGAATGRSLYGMYLAPFMAFMIVAAPSVKWRMLGAGAFVLVFSHVVVFGQGRGSTALAVVGMMGVFVRELRSLPATLLVLGPFLMVFATGFLDNAMAPFMERVTSQNLSEVDRLHHAQVGEKLVRSMSFEELLVGMDYRKVLVANGEVHMHNALFDMLTRFGLIATAPWFAFNVISLVAGAKLLFSRDIEREQTVGATVVFQTLIALTVGGIFANWRTCVLPGICTGLVLQAFQSKE